jgi:O-antigen/teichoic acid export membrane protein
MPHSYKTPARALDASLLPSLAENSLARLSANLVTLAAAFGTGVITARWLGPSAKGTLATLSLTSILIYRFSGLGLPEAAVVMKRRTSVPLQQMLSASVLPTTGAALIGASALWVVVLIANWYPIKEAVALQGAALFLSLHSSLFLGFINAEERFAISSRLTATRDAMLVVATFACVVLLGWRLTGAVLAVLVGELLLLGGAVLALRQVELRLRPSWDPTLVVRALPAGLVFACTYLLIAMAQRFDQLIVYQLKGPAEGGLYSVALTVSQLTAYAAGALSFTAFPRVATLDDEAAVALIERIARIALASALIAGGALAIAIPVGLRVAFGDAYAPATGPALLLVVAAIIFSQQVVLARSSAARGRLGVLIISFSVHVAGMIALGYWLIPTLGMYGGAGASIGGSLAGYVVCLHAYRRASPLHIPFRALLPRWGDFGDVLGRLRRMVAGRRRAGRD